MKYRFDTHLGYWLNKATFGFFGRRISKWYDRKYPLATPINNHIDPWEGVEPIPEFTPTEEQIAEHHRDMWNQWNR